MKVCSALVSKEGGGAIDSCVLIGGGGRCGGGGGGWGSGGLGSWEVGGGARWGGCGVRLGDRVGFMGRAKPPFYQQINIHYRECQPFREQPTSQQGYKSILTSLTREWRY